MTSQTESRPTRYISTITATDRRRVELHQEKTGNLNYVIVELNETSEVKRLRVSIRNLEKKLKDNRDLGLSFTAPWKLDNARMKLELTQQLQARNGGFGADESAGWDRSNRDGCTFTVFCKDETCGRGEYIEQIDVSTSRRSKAEAMRVAAAAIDAHYTEGVRAFKVVLRHGMFT
jgi:hypothetical protein